MDLMKLGRYVRADDVFSKKFVKFEAAYDPEAREIEVRLPTKGLMFRENDEGRLQIDLQVPHLRLRRRRAPARRASPTPGRS